jgi:hypothetical protein
MARPRKLVNVWDVQYQEALVLAHAQDTQVLPQTGCTDKFVTGADIIAPYDKKFKIK